MKHDWQGAHSADPDFQLSLHVESAPRSPVLGKSDRYQTDVTELTDTLQEFFRLIPRRQSGETDLYHFRIDCHQDVLGLLLKLVSSLSSQKSGTRLIVRWLATEHAPRQY
jgi:hypothetical protein